MKRRIFVGDTCEVIVCNVPEEAARKRKRFQSREEYNQYRRMMRERRNEERNRQRATASSNH